MFTRWQCASTLFDRGLGARKQGHDRSMVDARGTALRRACRMPQGEPDGGSEGRAFRSGRSPRDGPGRDGQASRAKLAMLTHAVEGHVHELVIKQGETVKKGQPIVELDQSVALADLAEKTATRDGLKASLALLKSLPRPEERRSNELAVEQAKVALERAQAALERLRPLRAQREVSEQQVFEAKLAVTSAKILQQTAEAQLHTMLIGPRPEAVAEAEAKITVADGAVAFSKAHLDLHTIRAPIDGVLDSL